MNPRLNFPIHELRDTEQLDRIPELFRIGDIDRRDAGNAFGIDLLEVNRCAVGKTTRMASLCAESIPATSKVGSASA